MVTPGMILSASVKARCNELRATRASCVDTRGNNWEIYRVRSYHPKTRLGGVSYRGQCWKDNRVQERCVWQLRVTVPDLSLVVGKVLIVIIVSIRRFPLNGSSCCAGSFRQCVLDRRFNVVPLRRRRWNERKGITLVGDGGLIYRLVMIVRCGPCTVWGSWGHRVTSQVAVSATMIVNNWVMLSAANSCADVADSAEIPEVFWIAVILAVETSFSVVQQ